MRRLPSGGGQLSLPQMLMVGFSRACFPGPR
jgi:hypothetical protein